MYFFPFLLCVIFIAIIVAFPFVSKFLFKIEGFMGLWSGFCCCCLCGVGASLATVVWFLLVDRKMKSENINGYSIGFTLAFSEWFTDSSAEPYSLGKYFVIMFFLTDICVYPLLFFFIRRLMKKTEANNQIFTFISGFGFPFVGVLAVTLLVTFGAIGDGENYDLRNGGGYASLLAKFIFFTFSYFLQIVGVILLLFLFLKYKNMISLIISIVGLFFPFIFIMIGLGAKVAFLCDVFPPFLYIALCGCGVFFYLKNSGDQSDYHQPA